MGAQLMSERRDFNRWPIMVEVTVDSAHTFYQDPGDRVFTWDISEGGIFIGAHRPPDIGTRLRFQFTLPDSDDPITALGEVQWVSGTMDLPAVRLGTDASATRPSGMGVRFMELSDNDSSRITRFIRDQQKAAIPVEKT